MLKLSQVQVKDTQETQHQVEPSVMEVLGLLEAEASLKELWQRSSWMNLPVHKLHWLTTKWLQETLQLVSCDSSSKITN